MKKLLLLPLLALIFSCNNEVKKEADVKKTAQSEEEKFKAALLDSLNQVHADTINIGNCPLRVDTVYVTNEDFYDIKDYYTVVNIRLTNISDKPIEAGTIKYKALDVYNQPALVDFDRIRNYNYGTLLFEKKVLPGKSVIAKETFTVTSIRYIDAAWPYVVAFSDRSKWEAYIK